MPQISPQIATLIRVVNLDWSPEPGERWQDKAECQGKDPNIFFPSRGASISEAKLICNDCAVSKECLEYALRNHEKHGIWGGASERERKRIAYRRRATAAIKAR